MADVKVERFEGKGKDPGTVQSHIAQYLQTNGFDVRTSSPGENGLVVRFGRPVFVVEAKKDGFLDGAVNAEQALTITMTGSPEDLTVRIGIGKWHEHLGTSPIEVLLISELFLDVDMPKGAWNAEIEDKLVKDLKEFMG
jgi:hypothetical protein